MRKVQLLLIGIITLCSVESIAQKQKAISDSTAAPVRILLAMPVINRKADAVTMLQSDQAAKHLPFFCESERQMDKRLPIPLRVRLGSVQQTDWLENKPAAIKPE